MEKGFIRAEVIAWSKLLEFASLQEAKENGAVRLEGKEYIVRDGDVIYFRFSK
jgi:ribosome-binding ATPase YchF (GTP1/OBG family)